MTHYYRALDFESIPYSHCGAGVGESCVTKRGNLARYHAAAQPAGNPDTIEPVRNPSTFGGTA